ncbi:MAG: hypothetical protein IKD06_06525 [Clostridia bacterium]|nr:hypothetical protein [Clostridia bacterium]
MKKVCCLFLVCLLLTSCSASPATAPATVPYTFGDGQTAPATQAGTLPVTQPETEEPPADPCTHSNKTYSYVDDSTCLRDCPFCGELTLEHDLWSDRPEKDFSCLWADYCSHCGKQLGEPRFEHRYSPSYHLFSHEGHAQLCMMAACQTWSAEEPHTFTPSSRVRDGKICAECTVCEAYFLTSEESDLAVCDTHKLSAMAMGYDMWYNDTVTTVFRCENCPLLLTMEERLELLGLN